MVTRPEPTIYGNCEGWTFIVGKKDFKYSPSCPSKSALQARNEKVMHNLFTI